MLHDVDPEPRFAHVLGTYNGKLVFTLCKTCAMEQRKEPCNHTGRARWLEGTWCTPEIHEAIDQGYKIIEVRVV